MDTKILFALWLICVASLIGCTKQKSGLPEVLVYKNATCECCKSWSQHLRNAGFTVEIRNLDNLNDVKQRVGIPAGMGSCHTAEVGGYFIEGHVPAADIKRLLAERPDAKGLAVPGMPVGSPGMESPTGETQPYDVLLVSPHGSTAVFSHHGSTTARQ